MLHCPKPREHSVRAVRSSLSEAYDADSTSYGEQGAQVRYLARKWLRTTNGCSIKIISKVERTFRLEAEMTSFVKGVSKNANIATSVHNGTMMGVTANG